jgi:quinolinate synthase
MPVTTLARYHDWTEERMVARIREIKAHLGDELTILGHHYQRDESIQFADYRGDSLGLSEQAAQTSARYILFCGVYFMAETAAVLAKPGQIVMQPVFEAFCPMARMATAAEAQSAWDALSAVWGDTIVPITYQNSTADVKAFVGRNGGAVCTSSNARQLFEWAFGRGERILFLPDEHLGTNTALDMGIPAEQVGVWNPARPAEPDSLADARVVVWQGFCNVHTRFTADDVRAARERYPGCIVVVHPECPREVGVAADRYGSTTGIIRAVERAPAGATVVVGTEYHLVQRLGVEHPDKQVVPLAVSVCSTMAMTRLPHILHALESIMAGEPINVVSVDAETAHWARQALERMLEAS